MKGKKLIFAGVIAIIALIVLCVPVFAAAPTTVTVNWNGGGVVNGQVNTGDTTTVFGVNANNAVGTFTATDFNDNPYSYGVDSNSAYMGGSFSNGGSMTFQTTRNTSYSPMYGSAGQEVYTFVGSNGSGSLSTDSGTNYAGMTNGMYGQTVVGGADLTANGSNYLIQQYVLNSVGQPSGNGAGLQAAGNGSAAVNDMTTGASGGSQANLGWGGGCYTNATAAFTGAGTFSVWGTASNSVSTPIADASGALVPGGWVANGNGSTGSATLNTIMNFVNGGSVGNFSVKVQ